MISLGWHHRYNVKLEGQLDIFANVTVIHILEMLDVGDPPKIAPAHFHMTFYEWTRKMDFVFDKMGSVPIYQFTSVAN